MQVLFGSRGLKVIWYTRMAPLKAQALGCSQTGSRASAPR